MSLERIVITFNANGTLRGISAQDFGELPKPITQAELAALAGTIDTATIARVGELESAKGELEFEKLVAESKRAELVALAESGDAEAVKAKAAEQGLSEKERKIARLKKELVELEAKQAAHSAEPKKK